jgi:hypothetical protein
MGSPKIDIAGQKFGLWTVLDYVQRGKWNCVCECGHKRKVEGTDLRKGKSQSCGCIANGQPLTYHGYSQHSLYKIHKDIEYRCYDPTDEGYHNYGGRGIYVVDEWRGTEGRLRFIEWSLENGWEKGLEVDRIDNDGPYAPWNCRFVTRKENDRNMRRNVYFEFQGKPRTVGEIIEIHNPHNFSASMVYNRLKKGLSVEESLNTPKLRNRQ